MKNSFIKKALVILFSLITVIMVSADNSGDNGSTSKDETKAKEKRVDERVEKTDEYKKEFFEAKKKHENDYPVFSQKGGMLRPMDHSFYFRTDDEWTGFSTLEFGYRFGAAEYFNVAVEFGVSPIPYVFLATALFHLKIYESPNKIFFMGTRIRVGYKYQDSDFRFMFGDTPYLNLKRQSIYLAPDVTVAFRFGRFKEFCVYYTAFPKFDFDIFDRTNTQIFFCPVMLGFEVRFGTEMEWSFAIESGYTMPMPFDSVPTGEWVNFPSLANVGVHYRFGDKFYKNLKKELKAKYENKNNSEKEKSENI